MSGRIFRRGMAVHPNKLLHSAIQRISICLSVNRNIAFPKITGNYVSVIARYMKERDILDVDTELIFRRAIMRR